MKKKLPIVLLIAACLVVVFFNFEFFRQLYFFSLKHEFASHIFMMPLISAFLILRNREKIFSSTKPSIVSGAIVCLLAAGAFLWIHRNAAAIGDSWLVSARTLSIIVLFYGIYLICFGWKSFGKALFPLLFLLLAVPIPDAILQVIIPFLQRGSAEAVALLFKITGTPFYRDDMTFVLRGMNIEIAAECSGIRSSLALLISSLLAAHLLLDRTWSKTVFVLAAVLMAMLKNGIRIVTLTLLAINYDPRWLTGSDLHRRGGIVFFVLALALLFPVLWGLRQAETRETRKTRSKSIEYTENTE